MEKIISKNFFFQIFHNLAKRKTKKKDEEKLFLFSSGKKNGKLVIFSLSQKECKKFLQKYLQLNH